MNHALSTIVSEKNVCETRIKQLLLAYTYFLNDGCIRYLSAGFSTITLKPVIILCNDNNNILELTPQEWYQIFLHKEDIDKHVNGDLYKNTFHHLSKPDDKRLILLNEKPQIMLGDDKTQIIIGKKEWQSILPMVDLLNTILTFYTKIHDDIVQYYIKYTQLCFEKNALCLGLECYFPTEQKVEFNSTRLFNELGLFFLQQFQNNTVNI